MYESCLKMQYAIYGEECAHPDIAISLNNLGGVYGDLGKHEEAMKMYERSIEMKKAIYGEECADSNIATSLNSLGRMVRDRGKLEDEV